MFEVEIKYGSLKGLRSQTKLNKNIDQTKSQQKLKTHEKNAPILNPQKKQSHFHYDKFHSLSLKLQSIKIHNIRPWIYQLYSSISYQKASLYGFNIRTLQNQLKNNQRTSLRILWGLYQTLNWQSMSLNDLQNFIKSMPETEEEVEQISVQNNKVKLNKLGMCLQVDILTNQFNLSSRKPQLNRIVDKHYQKSITKIVHQLKSYQFKGTILQVESNQLMIAVRTSTQLSIINPDGKIKVFNIAAKDIAVSQNRCYFAKNNNSIGSIFLQTTYLPKLNQMALEEKVFSDQLQDGQFFVSNDKITLIVDVNVKKLSIFIRKVQGQEVSFPLEIEPQGQQTLVSKKAFINQNHLHLLLFLGIGKNITKIINEKFFINY